MPIKKQTAVWITKSGDKLRICDMGDGHLLNTIRFLERNAEKDLNEERSAAWSCLGYLQGEMASFYAERDCDVLDEMTTDEWLDLNFPIYEKLSLEAERRGLTKKSLASK